MIVVCGVNESKERGSHCTTWEGFKFWCTGRDKWKKRGGSNMILVDEEIGRDVQ